MTDKDKEFIYENYFFNNLYVVYNVENDHRSISDGYFTVGNSYKIIGYNKYENTLELYDNRNRMWFISDTDFVLDIGRIRLEKMNSL